MREPEATEDKVPPGCIGGCLAFLVVGLLLIVFGWPSDAAKPWFYLVWGGVLLGSLAFERPAWMWNRRVNRRTKPYRFWITLAVGLLLIGLALSDLVGG